MKQILRRMFGSAPSQDDSSQDPSPEKTPYSLMGGEAGARALANRFYDIMAEEECAKPLYDKHPQPLDRIRQVFFEFLAFR